MKKSILFFASLLTSIASIRAQDGQAPVKNYRNFPLIVSVQFQNLAYPFHDIKSNFGHVGFALGTEVSYNGKQNWVQQFQAGYFLNKDAGNGFFAMTQAVYRPTVFEHFYPEVKAGIGWQRTFHPVEAYEFVDGSYVTKKGGKSQLIVPLGITIGYSKYKEDTYVSPFISYQVIPALFYNDGIPLNFYSLFQLGTRIHFK